ncbi:hypothetical protein EJB05_44300, partial [Eragrostis curvula]
MASWTILAAAEAALARRRRLRRQQRSLESVPTRDWTGLPPELISSIFHRLGPVEIMLGADKVCRSWRRAAREEPELWCRIDMCGHDGLGDRGLANLGEMAADALVRSQGQCEAFWGEGTDLGDNFLRGLANKAPLLKSLILIRCGEVSRLGFGEAVKRFPLLEELEFSKCRHVDILQALKDVAMACPRLKHLRLIDTFYMFLECYWDLLGDREAMAIATMHELRSLQIIYNDITNQGLEAIIENCPLLESLDIQKCRKIIIDDALRPMCARIKNMKLLVCDRNAKDYFRGYEAACSPTIDCSTCASHFQHGFEDKNYRRQWSISEANDKEDMVIDIVRDLHSLKLYLKDLTTQGLRAILEKCPHLESDDILQCRNIVMNNARGGEKYPLWRITTTRLLNTDNYGCCSGFYRINPEGLNKRNCRNTILENALGDTYSPSSLRKKVKNYRRKTKSLTAEQFKNNFYSMEFDREELQHDGRDIGECSTCLMIEYLNWKVLDSDAHSDYYDPSYGLDSIDETGFDVYDKMLHKRLR